VTPNIAPSMTTSPCAKCSTPVARMIIVKPSAMRL
jgi:hypothetical protein